MAFTTTYHGDRLILERAISDGPSKVWVQAKLFKNNVDPGKEAVAADFTEADYSGYNLLNMEFPTLPFMNADPKAQINATSHTWVRGAGDDSCDVWGIFIIDFNGFVTGYFKFSAAVAMDTPGVSNVFLQFSPTSMEAP